MPTVRAVWQYCIKVEKQRAETEAEVDELLSMFNTNQISQEEVDRECELVREELYDARQTR